MNSKNYFLFEGIFFLLTFEKIFPKNEIHLYCHQCLGWIGQNLYPRTETSNVLSGKSQRARCCPAYHCPYFYQQGGQ